MPRFSPGAMKSKRHGRSSTQSKTRGTQKKMRPACSFIPPDHGARKKRMSLSRAMGERGGDSRKSVKSKLFIGFFVADSIASAIDAKLFNTILDKPCITTPTIVYLS